MVVGGKVCIHFHENNLTQIERNSKLRILFDYAKAFDCVDCNKLWKILKEMEISAFRNWIVVKDFYVWFLWQIFGFNLGILLG